MFETLPKPKGHSKQSSFSFTVTSQKGELLNFGPSFKRSKQELRSSSLISSALTSRYPSASLLQLQPSMGQNSSLKKGGAFLQHWLEEVLNTDKNISSNQSGQQFLNINTMETNTQNCTQSHMRTHSGGSRDSSFGKSGIKGQFKNMEKYSVDRKYLRSQNLSSFAIDKLYRSLYIYSYGVNKVFEEILSLSPHSKEMIINLWEVYAKLLENCSCFSTAHQKVYHKQKQTIAVMEKNFQIKVQEFEGEKLSLQNQIKKLRASLQQKQLQIQKVQKQLQILQNTHTLTDNAFNNQVSLRLKFQQKINSIHSAYSELQQKYYLLVQRLKQKQQQLQNQKTKVKQMSQQIRKLQIPVSPIVQPSPTIQNVQVTVISGAQGNGGNTGVQEEIKKLLDKEKVHLQRCKELEGEIKNVKKMCDQKDQDIAKVWGINKKIQQDNHKMFNEIVDAKRQINSLTYTNQELQMKFQDLKRQFEICSQQLEQKTNMIKEKDKQLLQLKKQLENLKQQNQTIQINLKQKIKKVEQLSQLVIKYEQQCGQYNIKIKDKQDELLTVYKQMETKNQQFDKCKAALEKANKQKMRIQGDIQGLTQGLKNRNIVYNSQILKKQVIISEHDKKIKRLNNQLCEQTNSFQTLQQNYQILDYKAEKMKIEIQGKQRRIKNLQSQILPLNQTISQLQQRIIELQLEVKEKTSKIQILQFVEKKDNSKGRRAHIGQTVHPMIYEDLLSHLTTRFRSESSSQTDPFLSEKMREQQTKQTICHQKEQKHNETAQKCEKNEHKYNREQNNSKEQINVNQNDTNFVEKCDQNDFAQSNGNGIIESNHHQNDIGSLKQSVRSSYQQKQEYSKIEIKECGVQTDQPNNEIQTKTKVTKTRTHRRSFSLRSKPSEQIQINQSFGKKPFQQFFEEPLEPKFFGSEQVKISDESKKQGQKKSMRESSTHKKIINKQKQKQLEPHGWKDEKNVAEINWTFDKTEEITQQKTQQRSKEVSKEKKKINNQNFKKIYKFAYLRR